MKLLTVSRMVLIGVLCFAGAGAASTESSESTEPMSRFSQDDL